MRTTLRQLGVSAAVLAYEAHADAVCLLLFGSL